MLARRLTPLTLPLEGAEGAASEGGAGKLGDGGAGEDRRSHAV